MSLVDVHNEWDPLEEMIVGVADGARVPSPDRGLFALDYSEHHDTQEQIPTGPYRRQVVEQATEDLQAFVELLQGEGVVVRRPAVTDHAARFATPDWSADGEYNYCPRDVLLPVGQTVIETPMVLRTRYFEPLAYKDILLEYFRSGARWISAPKPRLLDDTYRVRPASGLALADLEPVFDAANVLRVGRDIVYLVSCSGNESGGRWLQQVLGDDYRVHFVRDAYQGTHIDTTITVLRPGLVLLNPERIAVAQIPACFKNWDVIWCPEMGDTGYVGPYPRASIWQGMNLVMVRPDLAVVNDQQGPLIREIEKYGIEVAPLRMRQARTLSGGFHCVSLDIRRRGSLEDYSS
ncbi:N-dimethylarginine dimethylaminohydrolase [Kitasatospora sp. MAP12-15]|uniref:inosamine-phosphate amidinotransferase 1 n=1 Tax=unclassified Kitasatospora TaxID=2633591 RepID=UPI002474AA68|nr:inosamine-phosphate amidinotransferase 1 [Kitasatospora sp. MAP12-44]MDH6109386.1 N-dimethylarginine dimethylaminohydrolase [Kitasatospora sp. MAP12-44]